jgi:hypothetical protein
MLRNHAMLTFSSSEHKSNGILDLVHLDIYGPMSVPSIIGSMYYVSFIYDFSCKTWVYFLNIKDVIFNKFQEFKDLIEN